MVKSALVILLLSILGVSVFSYQYDSSGVRGFLESVFMRLREAESLGADVRDEALMLNEALNLIRIAESNSSVRDEYLDRAVSIISDVNNSIPRLIENGYYRVRMNQLFTATTLISILVLCVLIYLYGSRVLWGLWLRARGKWMVEKK